MTTTSTMDVGQSWFNRATGWLDERGKPAWIAAIILGFILAWPIGLGILFYAIWSKRMFANHNCHGRNHFRGNHGWHRNTGNTAFDNYRNDTIKRLMAEQDEFMSFLERLRSAKDQAEFESFMNQRKTEVTRTEDDPQSPQA
jgi:hypothetical protein